MATRELTESTFEQTVAGDGTLVFSQPGALSAAALDQGIAGVQERDMDEVRAKVAAASASSALVGSV